MKIFSALGNPWIFVIISIILTGFNLGNSIYQQQVSPVNIIATVIYIIAGFLFGYVNALSGTDRFYVKTVCFWTAALVLLVLAQAISFFPLLLCLIFIVPAYGLIYYIDADSVFQIIAVCYLMASIMAAGYFIAATGLSRLNRKQ